MLAEVSIRRADLGLSELMVKFLAFRILSQSFNPPGGFGAFGTGLRIGWHKARCEFQSAGRIWGFRNCFSISYCTSCTEVSIRRADLGLSERHSRSRDGKPGSSFNPPGGFGAFGTLRDLYLHPDKDWFQSAGRIWGFRNRADEPPSLRIGNMFQSAGRIWGFRNRLLRLW
ncbi:hypothetical protein OSCT_0306 [Oscillochloris trichoides DG-6]|uniref:Uncharacterized protein n=1 Tax=Oscillochloris trichoides DG-6 TaxID=765420 RepID=E1IAF5_9CHLR|nr:hypothetical protein OSCT_0306 [Oscillochloris trichoides DG-6]